MISLNARKNIFLYVRIALLMAMHHNFFFLKSYTPCVQIWTENTQKQRHYFCSTSYDTELVRPMNFKAYTAPWIALAEFGDKTQ